MPTSKALRLYQAYERALERERLAWDHREHLKQQRPLDVGAYWEAQRAYERASHEQITAWAAWDAERKANEQADEADRMPTVQPPSSIFSEMAATETLLAAGALYEFTHPRLGMIGRLLVGPNARKRPTLTAQVEGLPNHPAWMERLALLQEIASACQQELSQRFGMPVAAPTSLVQAQRQVTLCQRLLGLESQAEVEGQVQRLSSRERIALQESLESGLWTLLAEQQGLRPKRIAQREQQLRRVLGER